jgi:hypothetical protein
MATRDLRKLARSKPCMVRISGVCDGGGLTTVLAHYRLAGVSGMGFKSPDVCGAWACAPCHAYVDLHHDDEARLAHLEGVIRTLDALVREGDLSW